jgi:hypothetical protein
MQPTSRLPYPIPGDNTVLVAVAINGGQLRGDLRRR